MAVDPISSICAEIHDPPRGMSARDRSREGAIKSDRSHIKHDLIRRVVGGQLGAWRLRNKGQIAIIDANAGDGLGVEMPQLDLFEDVHSTTTAELAVLIGERDLCARVILCERDKQRRIALADAFPGTIIVSDNASALDALPPGCEFAVWISDPCGPAGHGLDAMKKFARSIRSDFVIAFNEGAVRRIASTVDDIWLTSRERYRPMIESETYWADALARRRLARTPLIQGARNFRYRVLVAANFLSNSALRRPFEIVL